jgi:hypothetical protein
MMTGRVAVPALATRHLAEVCCGKAVANFCDRHGGTCFNTGHQGTKLLIFAVVYLGLIKWRAARPQHHNNRTRRPAAGISAMGQFPFGCTGNPVKCNPELPCPDAAFSS